MSTKRIETPTKFGTGAIEIEGNELRVKDSINPIWVRFQLTDKLREFLRQV